jgi:hypothetical protein
MDTDPALSGPSSVEEPLVSTILGKDFMKQFIVLFTERLGFIEGSEIRTFVIETRGIYLQI